MRQTTVDSFIHHSSIYPSINQPNLQSVNRIPSVRQLNFHLYLWIPIPTPDPTFRSVTLAFAFSFTLCFSSSPYIEPFFRFLPNTTKKSRMNESKMPHPSSNAINQINHMHLSQQQHQYPAFPPFARLLRRSEGQLGINSQKKCESLAITQLVN